jgi:hypothetical protein
MTTSFLNLIKTGRAIKRTGPMLLIRYAGEHNPPTRTLTYQSRRLATEGMRVLFLELSAANSDHHYNEIVGRFLTAIRDAHPVHTHECADPKKCRFDWSVHTKEPECLCSPTVRETAVLRQYVHRPIKKETSNG